MAQIIRKKIRAAKVPEGIHPAVIRTVTLRDNVETPYGIKDLIDVEYQVGDEFLIRSYTQSLHEKSAFFQVVLAVLGNLPYSDEEFDVDQLIDMPCKIHVEHRVKENGGVWENIVTVSPTHSRTRL